jgi:hypothetical protein
LVEINFDASKVDPDAGFEAIPTGWYNVAMDESSMVPTKDGAGTYLKCRFDVLDGQFKGRKVYHNLNLKNANPQTVEIAYKQLSAIAHAVGILQVTDTAHLHGRPLKIKVVKTPAQNGYDEGNDIKMFKNMSHDTGAAAAPAAAPAGGSTFTPPPTATAPLAPPATPAAPAAPAAPVDPLAAAKADGWISHPTSPGYFYKGQEVVNEDQLKAKYPAAPPPAAPAAPPAAPAAAWAPPAGDGATQPWAPPAAAAAAPPAAPPAPAAPHPAQTEAPPWAAPQT